MSQSTSRRTIRATAGGVAVILLTGLAAWRELGPPTDATGYVLAALGAFVVLGLAYAAARFIARHGEDIGEARFDTNGGAKPNRRPAP